VGFLEEIFSARAYASLLDLATRLREQRGNILLSLRGAIQKTEGTWEVAAVRRLTCEGDQPPFALLAELCAQECKAHVVGPDEPCILDGARGIIDAFFEHCSLGTRQQLIGDPVKTCLSLRIVRVSRGHPPIQFE